MFSFIVVVFLLFLIPGPAVIITISQTIKSGRKNGIMTALGIGLGDIIHALCAVLGLSAILLSSALAFEIVKYIGVIYLCYLGIRMLLTKAKQEEKPELELEQTSKSIDKSWSWKPIKQGFLAEILNPKTALFFLAFLPQFIQNDGSSVTLQLLVLGVVFVLMSIAYTTFLAYCTSFIGEKMFKTSGVFANKVEKIVGLIYIGLGIRLALQTQE
ncbi:LysE family translocator [Lederbergia sp. NSJ-179]|uniref:LysE family translocator n=1 Tax=Lederbergia sp. NSJ-179 TaxID=2931402 RepID=UPI001FD4CC27|nr:LysE family translocator [Lederbergia sp. NSJ-179]MCJ7840001.1 LysE family translocator [Lederbergia sp. NSJ-179]